MSAMGRLPTVRAAPAVPAPEGSDLDLLVDALPGATLFDLGGLQVELEALLGICVDLLTPSDLPASFRAQVLAQAQPV
jgi:predicted nucleotidyltransferase